MSKKKQPRITSTSLSYLFSRQNPIDISDLEFALKTKNYNIIKERNFTKSIITIKILDIARKNNVHVIYNESTIPTYLGVRSKFTQDTADAFETLTGVMREMDETIIDEAIGVELVIDADVFLDNKFAKHMMNLSPNFITNFNKQMDGDYMLSNMTLSSNPFEADIDPAINFQITPYHSDQRYAHIQIGFRTKESQLALDYLNECEDPLRKIGDFITHGEDLKC